MEQTGRSQKYFLQKSTQNTMCIFLTIIPDEIYQAWQLCVTNMKTIYLSGTFIRHIILNFPFIIEIEMRHKGCITRGEECISSINERHRMNEAGRWHHGEYRRRGTPRSRLHRKPTKTFGKPQDTKESLVPQPLGCRMSVVYMGKPKHMFESLGQRQKPATKTNKKATGNLTEKNLV